MQREFHSLAHSALALKCSESCSTSSSSIFSKVIFLNLRFSLENVSGAIVTFSNPLKWTDIAVDGISRALRFK